MSDDNPTTRAAAELIGTVYVYFRKEPQTEALGIYKAEVRVPDRTQIVPAAVSDALANSRFAKDPAKYGDVIDARVVGHHWIGPNGQAPR